MSVPIHATWYCTDRCTLACPHCYVPVVPAHARPRELDTQAGYRLIDAVVDADIYLLAFAGGEAMLRADFFELAGYASSRGLTVQVSTNGLNVDDSCVLRLLDAGFRCLQISLDGSTDQTNSWTRGTGSFERSLEAVRACRRHGLPVVLAFAFHRHNFNDVDSLADFAEREGVAIVKVQPIYFRFTYPGTGLSGTLDAGQLRHLDERLTASFQGRQVQLNNIVPAATVERAISAPRICCPSFDTPTIFPDGSLSPCFNGRNFACGDLSNEPFIPNWEAAIAKIKAADACGCAHVDIDVMRSALRRERGVKVAS